MSACNRSDLQTLGDLNRLLCPKSSPVTESHQLPFPIMLKSGAQLLLLFIGRHRLLFTSDARVNDRGEPAVSYK